MFDSYVSARNTGRAVSASQAANILCDAWTIEKKWKSRILIASTPRGNVYMHYDIYKGAFAYYSDTNLPYVIASAVAARYVIVFACRDLFLDESVLGHRSPLSWGAEPDTSGPVAAGLGPKLRLPVAQSEFPDSDAESVKLALKHTVSLTPVPSPASSLAEASVFVTLKKFSEPLSSTKIPLEKNKFVYMGRVRDVNLLQSSPASIASITPHNTSIHAPAPMVNKKNLTYDEYIEYRKRTLVATS
jgi:hypothetical protein